MIDTGKWKRMPSPVCRAPTPRALVLAAISASSSAASWGSAEGGGNIGQRYVEPVSIACHGEESGITPETAQPCDEVLHRLS
jgi:hypothetical protein